tara:strand:- start:586 stop:1032 length:447 start_codon:yes stop_codon:yes gene_type:complete
MFGEIDCRYRIFSQSEKDGVSIEEGVRRVVNKYCEDLIEIIKYSNKKKSQEEELDFKNIIIWGPHPPHRSPNHPYTDTKDMNVINNITKEFNEYLRLKSSQYNWKYISLFDKLNNSDINSYYRTNDTIHLDSQKVKQLYLDRIEYIIN